MIVCAGLGLKESSTVTGIDGIFLSQYPDLISLEPNLPQTLIPPGINNPHNPLLIVFFTSSIIIDLRLDPDTSDIIIKPTLPSFS